MIQSHKQNGRIQASKNSSRHFTKQLKKYKMAEIKMKLQPGQLIKRHSKLEQAQALQRSILPTTKAKQKRSHYVPSRQCQLPESILNNCIFNGEKHEDHFATWLH